ncbi:V-type ATP synthase subunit D [Bacteroidota bacterium]
MADKILMNKNTLAALKIELKEYKDALPIFEMKEQQLVGVVRTIEDDIKRLNEEIDTENTKCRSWIAVMAEEGINVSDFVKVKEVISEKKEIVGVTVQVFENIVFEEIDVDLFSTPLWLDAAIELVRDMTIQLTTIEYKKRKIVLLEEELSEARRMKNALKEVFIPETQDNIRKIQIYLGDVERLAIGCAKLVKKKKQDKEVAA